MQGTRSVSLSPAVLRRRIRPSHKIRIRVGPLRALVVHGLVGLIHRQHKFPLAVEDRPRQRALLVLRRLLCNYTISVVGRLILGQLGASRGSSVSRLMTIILSARKCSRNWRGRLGSVSLVHILRSRPPGDLEKGLQICSSYVHETSTVVFLRLLPCRQ
jgi:hypothetical protein